jgi:hypothetical protein
MHATLGRGARSDACQANHAQAVPGLASTALGGPFW